MELSDLLRSLRRYWIVAIAAFGVVLAIGIAAAYLPAERYRATATIVVLPSPDAANASPFLVSSTMPSLAARVQSRSFALGARARLEQEGKLPRAAVSVTAEGDPGTGILAIVAESTDPKAVAPWANAYAEHAIETLTATRFLELQPLDSAVEPVRPSAPVRPPIIFGSTALGLIAAVFAALATNALRHRLDNAEEIRRRFGTSVLGEIPSVRRRHRILASPKTMFGGTGPPGVVEAFQTLRTNLEIVLYAKPRRTIAVTSVGLGEGKSVVTAHLGWVLSSAGHDVLLIDADLRRPALHKLLEQPFGDGVNIAASANPLSLARVTGSRNLRFIPAGVPLRHPAEVVGVALPLLIEALGSPTRIILIDSPPLVGVAESSIVASVAGAVLLVIDARRPDFVDLERAIADLRDKGADILGVVINRTRTRRRRDTERYYHVPTFEPPAPQEFRQTTTAGASMDHPEASDPARRAAQQ